MQDNVYAAPAAVLSDAPSEAVSTAKPFFVVAPWKMALLFFATFGLYQLYWSYMHWSRFKRASRTSMWPVARSFFSIFFTHSLMEEMEHRADRYQRTDWSKSTLTTVYVVGQIAMNVLGRAPNEGTVGAVTTAACLLMLVPICWVLWRMQKVANIACGEADARSNARLTWANWIWLVIGTGAWLFTALGIVGMALGLDQ